MSVELIHGANNPNTQSGVVLLEALIAILIFSMGILALAGLQATMLKNTNDAKFRADASYIAQKRLGVMWSDPANLADYIEENTNIGDLIPNGLRTVTVKTGGVVNVTVQWQQPGQSEQHKFTANARIVGDSMQNAKGFSKSNFGFSLVEIMVGLVIGLLATAVIMQVFSTFEGDKRSTTGTADAQTNGTIALYNIQRDVQNAGFGLPVFDSTNSPFNCSPVPIIDHDKTATTPDIDLFPILITDSSGPAGSDSIAVRYGNTMNGGISVTIRGGTPEYRVDTSLGCAVGDTVVVMKAPSCYLTTIPAGGLSSPGATPVTIALSAIPGSPTITDGAHTLACLGIWNEYTYSVKGNQLIRSGGIDMTVTPPVPTNIAVPLVPDIVNVQAQYGISSTASENKVTQWVDATGGTWAAASIPSASADRKRIKAIRVAVVSRNGAIQKGNVSFACSSTTAAAPTGVCAWAGTVASPAPAIDLSGDKDWQRYRYRVYETIIPLKNVIWSRGAL